MSLPPEPYLRRQTSPAQRHLLSSLQSRVRGREKVASRRWKGMEVALRMSELKPARPLRPVPLPSKLLTRSGLKDPHHLLSAGTPWPKASPRRSGRERPAGSALLEQEAGRDPALFPLETPAFSPAPPADSVGLGRGRLSGRPPMGGRVRPCLHLPLHLSPAALRAGGKAEFPELGSR